MTTNERRFQVTVHYKASDNGIIADGMNGTTTATAEQAANWIIIFAEENSSYTVTEFNIRDCETFKKYRSNDADLQALVKENVETKAEVKTIETKIATNGVKLYYVDGKRTSREVALQAAADNRENLFTIEYATRHNAYFTGRILDATQVYESTSKAVLKELELKIDEYHGFTVKLHTIGWVEICKLFNKDYAKSLINKIENAFIRGEYGVKIDKYGKFSILPAPVIEPNPDDYAVNPDALEVAVNAEIQNANNEIHSCFYKQDDNGNLIQISYEQAQAEADEALAKFCGLSPEQYNEINNEESQVEPDTTPQVDPIIQERETARNEYDQLNAVRKVIEKDCERYERLRNRCKSGSTKRREYYQLLESFKPILRAFEKKFIAAQDRYNKSLTLRTDEEHAATQKAIDTHNADLDARGIKYFATVYYYPNGIEGEDMETFHKECTSLNEANAFVSQEDHDGVYVGGVYDAGWEITDRNHNLIADHITGIKEESQMTTNMQLAAQIVESLGNVIVKFANAGEGNNGELALHYETYHDENDEFGTSIPSRHPIDRKKKKCYNAAQEVVSVAIMGDPAYTLSIGWSYDNKATTRSISGINYDATETGDGTTALGADATILRELAQSLVSGIVGGSANDPKLNASRIIYPEP